MECRDAFPTFPSHYVPGRTHLTAAFVRDYWEHKPYIMQELCVSSHGLAVDHQRKVDPWRKCGGPRRANFHHLR